MSVYKHNKFYSFADFTHFLLLNKIPFLLWILIVFISAVTFQHIHSPLLLNSIIVGAFMMVHVLLYWYSDVLIAKKRLVYFIGQTMIIFAAAFILPIGSISLLVGLLPLLIAQSIIIFKKKIQVVIVFSLLYSQYCIVILLNYGRGELLEFILIFIFILIIVVFYYSIYHGQVNARIRTQYYLTELEAAHIKLEELTLANERQRMARDLHDTLAQGLAGLIMQLDAADSYLENGNAEKSQEIIRKSMDQARKTLREARIVIDNLRENSLADMNFEKAVTEEIERFKENTLIAVESLINVKVNLSNLLKEHSLYIISEGLTNIAKHSHATKAAVTVIGEKGEILIKIEDNGIGFDNVTKVQRGSYGLLGLKERVKIIGGELSIESELGKGTKITVRCNLNKGVMR